MRLLLPNGQLHWYMFMKGVEHVALFWHGDDRHSFISISQFLPVYPGKQLQLYVFKAICEHRPFTQGFELHTESIKFVIKLKKFQSSFELYIPWITFWQFWPSVPGGQLHTNWPGDDSEHVPEFKHGFGVQTVLFLSQYVPVNWTGQILEEE